MASRSTLWRQANPDKHKAYVKQTKAKIALSNKEYNNRTKVRRKKLLSEFCCRSCSNSNVAVIQWHHLDPSTKDHNIFHGTRNEDTFWNEVLKCVPLCANCHLLIHKDLLCLIPPKLR